MKSGENKSFVWLDDIHGLGCGEMRKMFIIE